MAPLLAINKHDLPYEKSFIKDNTNNIFIYSNIIRGYGKIRTSGVGIIASFGEKLSIISNHVFDGYYTGISVGWGWNQYHQNKNTYIAGNSVHHLMKFLMCDGGGIYTQSSWDGGSIECNQIYSINTRSRKDCSIGIYHDEGSADILDYKNVIYNCDYGISGCYKNGLMINNVLANIGSTTISEKNGSDYMTSYSDGNKVVKINDIKNLSLTQDYRGKTIPQFNSKFKDFISLSNDQLIHFQELYKLLSLNK